MREIRISFLRNCSLLTKVSLAAAVSVPFLLGQRGPRKMEESVHRAEWRNEWRHSASAQAIRSMARPARKVSLGALNSAESRPITRKPGLSAVGVSRQFPKEALAQGEWTNSPDGKRVWRLALSSTGAETLRLRFVDFHAGSGSVWLLGTQTGGDSVTVGPYTADGPFGDGEFWSDMVPGDSLIVAYEPAAGASSSEAIPFSITEVSHRFVNAGAKPAAPARAAAAEETDAPLTAAASCTLDAACYPQYREPASAVALMVFESDGGTYECTGSLIGSAAQPALPFLLTANHCVSTVEEARSLITFFNYQTASCGGGPPSLNGLPRVTGAAFIAGQPMALGDFSLLRLSAFPNMDVTTLGWSADEIGGSEDVVSISHPLGDYKRIAFGQRTRDATIRFSNGERMPANAGYQVGWSQGVTQSGSSGSPMLRTIGGKQYVVGTLSAGPGRE